jgi:hypothetical protein
MVNTADTKVGTIFYRYTFILSDSSDSPLSWRVWVRGCDCPEQGLPAHFPSCRLSHRTCLQQEQENCQWKQYCQLSKETGYQLSKETGLPTCRESKWKQASQLLMARKQVYQLFGKNRLSIIGNKSANFVRKTEHLTCKSQSSKKG